MADFSLFDLHGDIGRIEVVDLGAFEDPMWPSRHMKLVQAGRARVTGFDPDLAGCLRLSAKYGSPHRFFPVCVGNGRSGTFYATNRNQTASLFEPNTPLLKLYRGVHEVTTVVTTSEVGTVRLDDALPDADVDYMKLDVQGAELDAMQGGEKILGAVVALQIEVAFTEIYRGQPLFADVDTYLRRQGFWLHLFPGIEGITMNPFQTGGKQALWTDAVYTRHPMELAALSDTKLWKLAALLHDLYDSFDFTYRCLAELDTRAGTAIADAYRARLGDA